jgi:hypothetical protein
VPVTLTVSLSILFALFLEYLLKTKDAVMFSEQVSDKKRNILLKQNLKLLSKGINYECHV